MAQVNGMNGLILLPDDWNGNVDLNNVNPSEDDWSFSDNVVFGFQWTIMEQAGVVFFPAAGMILQMPEGMSIVSDGTGFKVTLNADVIENHIVKSTMTDNNCFKFAVFSSTNSELNLRKNGNFGIGNTLQGKLFYTIQIKEK